jgi:hypothetical protein
VTQKLNNARGGTAGATVTTGNSGGDSGDAWNTVSIGTGGALTFDDTHLLHILQGPGLAYELSLGATSGTVLAEWTISGATLYFRVYLYFTANPAAGIRPVAFRASASLAAAIGVSTAGKLQLINAANSVQQSFTESIPLNQWFRVEGQITGNASTGVLSASIFNDADSVTADETHTLTAQNTSGSLTQIWFGQQATAANVGPYWLGDMGVSDTALLGPSSPELIATEDSAYPPRINLSSTTIAVDDVVTIYRVVSGERTAIRGADGVTATDTGFVVNDGEYPFGVPVSWVLSLNGADAAETSPVTVTLPGGKVAISDAISGLAAEVVITAWPDKTADRASTQFTVGGRLVVVAAPRGGAVSQVEVLTEASLSRENMLDVLNGTTEGIILIRQPGGYNGVDGTYYVTADTEARAAQQGTLERRLWTLNLAECDGWAPALAAGGWTLADIDSAYTDLTLADLDGDFATLLAIAIYDWGLGI